MPPPADPKADAKPEEGEVAAEEGEIEGATALAQEPGEAAVSTQLSPDPLVRVIN